MKPKEWIEWQYQNSAADPNSWLRHARSLKQAADLVFLQAELEEKECMKQGYAISPSKPSLGPVYMMLSGLAIENLIKGIYSSKNGILDEMKTKLNENIGHEGLKKLLDSCAITLEKEEYEIMERMKQFVISWGRYPISKSSKRTYPSGVSENEPRIPLNGIIKDGAEGILKRNKEGDFSELTTIQPVFMWNTDKNLIDKIYINLESQLVIKADVFRPDFSNHL